MCVCVCVCVCVYTYLCITLPIKHTQCFPTYLPSCLSPYLYVHFLMHLFCYLYI